MNLMDIAGKDSVLTAFPAAQLPSGDLDTLSAAYEQAKYNSGTMARSTSMSDAREKRDAMYLESFGTDISALRNTDAYWEHVEGENKAVKQHNAMLDGSDKYMTKLLETMRGNPEFAEKMAGVPSEAEVEEMGRDIANASTADYEAVKFHSVADYPMTMDFLAGTANALVDPAVMITLPFGAGQGTVLKAAVTEGLIALGSEIPMQVMTKSWANERDLKYTTQDMLVNGGLGVAGAAAFAGIIRGSINLLGKAATPIDTPERAITYTQELLDKVDPTKSKIKSESGEPDPLSYEPQVQGFAEMTRVANIHGTSPFYTDTMTIIANDIHLQAQNPQYRPTLEQMEVHNANMEAVKIAMREGDISSLKLGDLAFGRWAASDLHLHDSWNVRAKELDVDINSDKDLNQLITYELTKDLVARQADLERNIIPAEEIDVAVALVTKMKAKVVEQEEILEDILEGVTSSQGVRGEKFGGDIRDMPVLARSVMNATDKLRTKIRTTEKMIEENRANRKEAADIAKLLYESKGNAKSSIPPSLERTYSEARKGIRESRLRERKTEEFETYYDNNPTSKISEFGQTLLNVPLRTPEKIKTDIADLDAPEVAQAIKVEFEASKLDDFHLYDPVGGTGVTVRSKMDDIDVDEAETKAMSVCSIGGGV